MGETKSQFLKPDPEDSHLHFPPIRAPQAFEA
jgi:hypothetical protein